MSTINDFIQSIATDQLSDATASVHELLGQRVLQTLDTRKHELASTLFQTTAAPTEGT